MSLPAEFARFPKEWRVLPFLDAITDATAGNPKIKVEDYLESGLLPIVDQGQEQFNGYTSDPQLACDTELPAIVFGDHTRRFKFIEEPFALGADGAKLLKPKVKFDPKFLYYYLSQLKIESAGYSRHYKFLKETFVPVPPLATQKHIARVLEQADQLRKQAQQMESELNQLAQSLFLERFGDPLTNPRGWKVVPLDNVIATGDKINYGVVQPGDDVEVGIPLVRVADLSPSMDSLHGLKKIQSEIEAQYSRSRLVGDEILIGCVGSIGRVGLASPILKGANIARAVARVRPSNSVSRMFLYFYLQTPFVQGYFHSETRTVSQPTLNISLIEKTPVIVPPLDKQREFDFAMDTIQLQMKNLREKSVSIDALFSSLMQRAFKGELTAPGSKAA